MQGLQLRKPRFNSLMLALSFGFPRKNARLSNYIISPLVQRVIRVAFVVFSTAIESQHDVNMQVPVNFNTPPYPTPPLLQVCHPWFAGASEP